LNQNYIDHVQILVAESLGIEARAEYYESAGAIRDIVQNHMMQILCLIAMDATAYEPMLSAMKKQGTAPHYGRSHLQKSWRVSSVGQYSAGHL